MILIARGLFQSCEYREAMKKHPQLVALGNRIRKIRESQGYTQEEFAAEAELDRSYYGGVERGERNVATLNLIPYCQSSQGQSWRSLSLGQGMLPTCSHRIRILIITAINPFSACQFLSRDRSCFFRKIVSRKAQDYL